MMRALLLSCLLVYHTESFQNSFTQPKKNRGLLELGAHQNRRGFFTTSGLSIASFLSSTSITTSSLFAPSDAQAVVFVDPDRYGDKEIKVGVVNKVRQNIRDSIVNDPSLAPLFLKLAIQDALTYNAATQDRGPDGSIVGVVLNTAQMAELKPAAQVLVKVRQRVKRTTEITYGDLVTYAGAEAIETLGGPRVSVQVGKLDPKAMGEAPMYPDLSDAKQTIPSFRRAGLTERDAALLLGAIGAMNSVLQKYVPEVEEEQEENEMGDKDIFLPQSFGGPSEIYGKRLGVMDSSVFDTIASDLKQKKTPFNPVFADASMAEWVAMYSKKKSPFLKDLPSAYSKMMGLGQSYTGGKIENLLGSGEFEI